MPPFEQTIKKTILGDFFITNTTFQQIINFNSFVNLTVIVVQLLK